MLSFQIHDTHIEPLRSKLKRRNEVATTRVYPDRSKKQRRIHHIVPAHQLWQTNSNRWSDSRTTSLTRAGPTLLSEAYYALDTVQCSVGTQPGVYGRRLYDGVAALHRGQFFATSRKFNSQIYRRNSPKRAG